MAHVHMVPCYHLGFQQDKMPLSNQNLDSECFCASMTHGVLLHKLHGIGY